MSEHERCVIFSFFFAFLSLLFFCFGLTNHNSQSKAVQQTRAKKKTRERENLWSHLVLSSFRPFLYFPNKYTQPTNTLNSCVHCCSARGDFLKEREREREINNNARNHGAPDCDDDDENVAMVWTQRAQSDEEEDYHRNRSFRFFHIG